MGPGSGLVGAVWGVYKPGHLTYSSGSKPGHLHIV